MSWAFSLVSLPPQHVHIDGYSAPQDSQKPSTSAEYDVVPVAVCSVVDSSGLVFFAMEICSGYEK